MDEPPGTDPVVRRELDVESLDDEQLRGAVQAMYENGVDELALVADRIGARRRRTIQEAAKSLVGAELLEETGTRVVVESVIEPEFLTLERALARIRSLALTMLGEALHALRTGDEDLARSVIDRDEEVDRLWSFVCRRFRRGLNAPATDADDPLSHRERLDHYEAARQLERVADAATEIAATIPDDVPSDVAVPLESLAREIAAATETVVQAVTADDPDRARELIGAYRDRIAAVERDFDDRGWTDAVDDDGSPATPLVAALQECVGYTRNLERVARYSAYPGG